MTTLLIQQFDPDAPGSWRKRRRILEAIQVIEGRAEKGINVDAILALDDILLEQVSTDDDSPVDDVLDRLSVNEFNELFRALLGTSVPPTNAANS